MKLQKLELKNRMVVVEPKPIQRPLAPQKPRYQEAPVTWHQLEIYERSKKTGKWPVGEPLPEYHLGRVAAVCESCRLWRLAGGGFACVLSSRSSTGTLYFRCRGCGCRFKRQAAEPFGGSGEMDRNAVTAKPQGP